MSMSEACILITYHVSLAFVFLYFQWHATKLFENLVFAVFSLLRPLSFLFTVVTVKILNTSHLSLEVTPSRLPVVLISWPCVLVEFAQETVSLKTSFLCA